jgi:large subunit ribosomal protein L5
MAYASLHDRLRGPIAKGIGKRLGVKNIHALPQVEKITVNVGINKSKMDSKEMHAYIEQCLMQITGQKPVFTKARIAISNFKTREGMVVGCRVTLRGRRMEEFLDTLLSYAIPRIRDFRGLPSKLDGQGNYSIGIRDQSIFPEVPAPEAKQIFGLQIVISTTAKNDKEGMALFTEMGMPFRRDKMDEKEKQAAEKVKAEKAAAEEAAKEDAKDAEESEDTKEKKSSESSDSSESSESSEEKLESKPESGDTAEAKSDSPTES